MSGFKDPDEGRAPDWGTWSDKDFARLVGVDVTEEQIRELSGRTNEWGPDNYFYDPIDDVFHPDPLYRVDNPYFPKEWTEGQNRREWEKLRRRCQSALQCLEDDNLRLAILEILRLTRITPKGIPKGIISPPPDLTYIFEILRAIARSPMPIFPHQERAKKRGVLAVVIGQWWFEVTGKKPTEDWKKFEKFLLELVNIKISKPAFYRYWRNPKFRYYQPRAVFVPIGKLSDMI